MSLSSALRATTLATVFVAAHATAADPPNADPPNIEPLTTDLSKPVLACVISTPGFTAAKKLEYILDAQGLMFAASANKVGKTGIAEDVFAVAKDLSGKGGYLIASSDIKENHNFASRFCLMPLELVVASNVVTNLGVPSPVNRGELGEALTNHNSKGTQTSIIGRAFGGKIFAAVSNPESKKGGLYVADAYGRGAGTIALYKDFSFTSELRDALLGKSAKLENGTKVAKADPALSAMPN